MSFIEFSHLYLCILSVCITKLSYLVYYFQKLYNIITRIYNIRMMTPKMVAKSKFLRRKI